MGLRLEQLSLDTAMHIKNRDVSEEEIRTQIANNYQLGMLCILSLKEPTCAQEAFIGRLLIQSYERVKKLYEEMEKYDESDKDDDLFDYLFQFLDPDDVNQDDLTDEQKSKLQELVNRFENEE